MAQGIAQDMVQDCILHLEKVSVDFDGFLAVNEMDFTVHMGELRFLIGPNGAGKTTLLDLICGKIKPSKGAIMYKKRIDLTRKEEHQIAQLGIGRKFQAPSIFPELTVWENLELAMKQKRGIWTLLTAKLTGEEKSRIEEQLHLIGLQDSQDLRAGGLSHGQKQWLEIGMMLMQEPTVLLLDEPAAGMTDKETEKTGEILLEIKKNHAVVVVEHDMEFVQNFASLVTVMHQGSCLMEGSMQEVQADSRVAEVYLGKKAG